MSMPTLPELFANVQRMIAYKPGVITTRTVNARFLTNELYIFNDDGTFELKVPLDTPFEVIDSMLYFEGCEYQFRLLMDFVDFTGNHMAPEEPEPVSAVVFYMPSLSPEKLEKYMDQIRLIHNEGNPGKPLSLLGLIGKNWIYKIIPDRNGAAIAADEFEEKVIELVGKTYAKHLMARAYNPGVYNLEAATVQFLGMKPVVHKHYYNPKRLDCRGPRG